MDSDEYFSEEEPEMKAEMGAFQRAGGVGLLGTKIDTSELKGRKMDEIAKKLSRISMSPQERLSIYVEALSFRLKDQGVVSLSGDQLQEMLSFIPFVNKAAYINPVGFIMGYAATEGGKSMKNVKKIIEAAKKLHDEAGFGPYDVLRYSRLWTSLRG